ncbi:MAG TPA: DUF3303 family protein [Fimbriimonadaceae bacterium]|nr:DUF3303 family protein [Fimbriimonadaceae bacterium]
MLFMVVEHFGAGSLESVGARFQSHGRMLPDGVVYVDSWMTPDGSRCFQLMVAPDRDVLQEWLDRWSDLVAFEVDEVVGSSAFWAARDP